jgi:hypothetical protein
MRHPIALPLITALLGACSPFATAEILVASDQNFKTIHYYIRRQSAEFLPSRNSSNPALTTSKVNAT